MTPSPKNKTAQRQILVTSALPYANGPIHLGHLVEYIQTDIWVRFQRLRGHECIYVCADDAHGTPIMLKARAEGIEPEALIERIGHEHRADFARLPRRLRPVPQHPFAGEPPLRGTHLHPAARRRPHRPAHHPPGLRPRSRHVPAGPLHQGRVPAMRGPDQYGDSCEACGATYAPTDLKNPVSAISGATPVEKESEHYFFRLADFSDMLRKWTGSGSLQPEIRNKLDEWFKAGLRTGTSPGMRPTGASRSRMPRASISTSGWTRPSATWRASSATARAHGLDFDAWWSPDSTAELHHFIGKDIAYFHTLFWPAMLTGAGFRAPTAVHCHGFLTVNGQKMSKSRGTFIKARTYLDHLNPEYLRYYFAAKLGAGVDDIDLNLDDFIARVNSDLVGKVVNIASRCAGFIHKRFNGRLAEALPDPISTSASPAAGTRSPASTRDGSSARPCARSWPWPMWPTSTSTSTSRGCWQNRRAARTAYRRYAARGSTCSGY
jgi:methionyl-tRNA synthetase